MLAATASLGTVWRARAWPAVRTLPAVPTARLPDAVRLPAGRANSPTPAKEPVAVVEMAKQLATKREAQAKTVRHDADHRQLRSAAENYRALAEEIERSTKVRERVGDLLKPRGQDTEPA